MKAGEVTIEIKAGLSIDKKTFDTCMRLIGIYVEGNGGTSMVVDFKEDDDPEIIMHEKPLISQVCRMLSEGKGNDI